LPIFLLLDSLLLSPKNATLLTIDAAILATLHNFLTHYASIILSLNCYHYAQNYASIIAIHTCNGTNGVLFQRGTYHLQCSIPKALPIFWPIYILLNHVTETKLTLASAGCIAFYLHPAIKHHILAEYSSWIHFPY